MIKRFAVIFFVSQLTSLSYALKMTPIEMDFTAGGSGRTQTIVLENDTVDSAAITIKSFSRSMDVDGKETQGETSDFKVYPPVRKMMPGEKRSFRVTYVGDENIKEEKAYRLHVKQLPLDLDVLKDKAKKLNSKVYINVNVNYVASLYVKPEKSMPILDLEVNKELAKNKFEATITNKGNAHGILRDYYVGATINGEEKNLRADEIGKDFPSVNILANGKRKVTLTFPEGAEVKKDTIKLNPANTGK